jgi:hypothetical protein
MGEERRRIDGLDLFRCLLDRLERVAVLALAIGLFRSEAFLEMLGNRGAGHLRVGSFVPHDRQRIERRLGAPPGVGDDRDRRV